MAHRNVTKIDAGLTAFQRVSDKPNYSPRNTEFSFQYRQKFLERKKAYQTNSMETENEDVLRRLERVAWDHGMYNNQLKMFKKYLYQDKAITYPRKPLDFTDRQVSVSNYDERNHLRQKWAPKLDKMGTEPDVLGNEIKCCSRRCEERQRQCYHTISDLKDQLRSKQILLDIKDVTITATKQKLDKEKTNNNNKIVTLELENKCLIQNLDKLKIKFDTLEKQNEDKNRKISELTDVSNLRWKANGDIEINERYVSKVDEFKRNIASLERDMKEKDEKLFEEKKKYNKCLSEHDEMKSHYESSISSLRNENIELTANIKLCNQKVQDLEDELKKNIMTSTGNETRIIEKENENSKRFTEMQAQCQEKTQQINYLEKRLNETLDKVKRKEEELRDIEASYKRTLRNIEAENVSRQRTTHSIEKTNEMNETKFELAEKEFHLQKKQQQQVLNDMREQDKILEKEIDLQTKEIQSLKNELKLCKEAYNQLVNSIQSRRPEKKTEKEASEIDNIKKITELKVQLKDATTKLNETEAELAETKTRLSRAMGDRLTDNNPNITDLSDRNRPTKLAEKFAELYDNQWTDAFDVLEKLFHSEENVIDVLLQILQDVWSFCEKKATTQMENLGLELKLADKHGKGDIAADVLELLKDCRKAVGMSAVRNLQAMYLSYLKNTTNEKLKSALRIDDFTSECVEICWFMVIQDPPVAFAPLPRKGSRFDNDYYKPYTRSGIKVEFSVWPPLLLHEGGPILAKGVAQGWGK